MEKRILEFKLFFQDKKVIHHTTEENKKYRPGLIEIPKILKNYGMITSDYIEAFSSGGESDIEDEKINEASVFDICEKLVDFRTLLNVVRILFIYLFK